MDVRYRPLRPLHPLLHFCPMQCSVFRIPLFSEGRGIHVFRIPPSERLFSVRITRIPLFFCRAAAKYLAKVGIFCLKRSHNTCIPYSSFWGRRWNTCILYSGFFRRTEMVFRVPYSDRAAQRLEIFAPKRCIPRFLGTEYTYSVFLFFGLSWNTRIPYSAKTPTEHCMGQKPRTEDRSLSAPEPSGNGS